MCGIVDSVFPGMGGGGGAAGDVIGSVIGGPGKADDLSDWARGAGDPFASQRGQYQEQLTAAMSQLNDLMTNPDFSSNPAYKFGLNQGTQQLERVLASRGYLDSGNELAAVDSYSQGYAQQFRNNELNNSLKKIQQLSVLSGANLTPQLTPAIQAQQNSFDQGMGIFDMIGQGIGMGMGKGWF